MKAMSKFWTALVVGGLVMVSTALSWAGPLLPPFPSTWAVGQEVAGQTTLGADTDTGLPALKIDWIVKFLGPVGPGGANVWAYYYQIENDTPTTVSAFTVLTPGPPFFAAGGPGLGFDLDVGFVDPLSGLEVSPHLGTLLGGPFANLDPPDPESENAVGGIDLAESVGIDFDNTTWGFSSSPHPTGELPPGWQSEVLIAYAFAPPMYGEAEALDSPAIGPWKSTNPGGQLLPVPSPEPTTAALLIMGMLGLGAIRWRRQKA